MPGRRVVVIVQARVGSSRLPGKVFLDLDGKPALFRTLERAKRIPGVDEVIVATSTEPVDVLIQNAASKHGYRVVRGSEQDVLARYLLAAREATADVIVRITSDCPLLDPAVSGVVVDGFLRDERLDYASNVMSRRLPRGLDTEVFSRAALERVAAGATDPRAREHVTWGIYSDRQAFACGEFVPSWAGAGLDAHRWTLDTLADYHFLSTMYRLLGPEVDAATTQDVLAMLAKHPDVASINAGVAQKL